MTVLLIGPWDTTKTLAHQSRAGACVHRELGMAGSLSTDIESITPPHFTATDFRRSDPAGGDLLALADRILVRRPGLSLTEFALQLNCTETVARSLLERLADLSLRQRETGADSDLAISTLVARQQLIARERERHQNLFHPQVDLTSSSLSNEATVGTADVDDLTEYLPGTASVQHRLRELAGSARTEIVSFRPTPDTSF